MKKIFILILFALPLQAAWHKKEGQWTYSRNPFNFEEEDRKIYVDQNGDESNERPADFNG